MFVNKDPSESSLLKNIILTTIFFFYCTEICLSVLNELIHINGAIKLKSEIVSFQLYSSIEVC